MVITILRRIYCYYDFDSVFTTYRIGNFILISSQVKCVGSNIHGDDFTTSYSYTT